MTKTILITGAASGIGYALAQQLSQTYKIYGLDIRKPQKKIPEVRWVMCDVTNKISLQKLRLPKIDILINNAGIMIRGKIFEHTPQQIHKLFNIHVLATWQLLKKTKPKQTLYISSRHALQQSKNPAWYALTKQMGSLMHNYTPISHKIAYLGPVDTQLHKGGQQLKTLTPQQAAKKIIYLLESKHTSLKYYSSGYRYQ